MITLIWSVLLLYSQAFSSTGEAGACENISQLNVSIHNLKDDVIFTLRDVKNLSSYEINMTYSWNFDGSGLDGFLYCFRDADDFQLKSHKKRSLRSSAGSSSPNIFDNLPLKQSNNNGPTIDSPISYVYSPSEQRCEEKGQYWVTSRNGTYTGCTYPCGKELGLECLPPENDKICRLLRKNCKALHKETRTISFPVRFGRRYTFDIHPYAGHFLAASTGVESYSVFCRHQLIETNGISMPTAYQFCQREQEISALSTSAGIPSNFSLYNVSNDFAHHKATVVVRWKAPHDIVPGFRVIYYFFKTFGYGSTNESNIKAKSCEEERIDPYYYRTVSMLDYNKTYRFTVQPYVAYSAQNCRQGHRCQPLGLRAEINFKIDDIDACNGTSSDLAESYCHPLANCNDSTPNLTVPANCTCPDGYQGNGINPNVLARGDGCTNYDACHPSTDADRICSSIAHCIDHDPPSMGANCSCPNTYIGDGRIAGSECQRLPLEIGLGVGIPLTLIFVSLGFFLAWKYKGLRRKALDRAFSTFVASRSNTYVPPLVISNNNLRPNSSPNQEVEITETTAFGKDWEIDRNYVIRQGVIGRGNFGVVHKATLLNGNKEQVVAVKSLTGTYSTNYREDFLAEIALLISLGSHDNVLGVIGVCTSQISDGSEPTSPLLITQYMPHGDLLHFLWDSREASKKEEDPIYDFTEISIYKIGRQVASGMHFLSQSRVIHGDVAARNVLVGENLQCKISDFGLANDVYRYGMIKCATERRVPFKWISPERMLGGGYPITWRSDVWSFGILLYEMVTLGSAPYPGMDQVTIFQKVKSGYRMPKPSSCNDYLYNIMIECWNWEAIRRPTFKQLEEKLGNPFLPRCNGNAISLCRTLQALNEIDQTAYETDCDPQSSCNENLTKVSTTTNGAIPNHLAETCFSILQDETANLAHTLSASSMYTENETNENRTIQCDDILVTLESNGGENKIINCLA